MMRKILIFSFLVFCGNLMAQQTQVYNIYNTTNGFQNFTPTQQVEVKQNVINVYNVNQTTGFREISPLKTIEIKPNNTIEIYKVNTNGLKEITPTQIIVPNEPQYNFIRFDIFSTTN
jgi:hypothetical protein